MKDLIGLFAMALKSVLVKMDGTESTAIYVQKTPLVTLFMPEGLKGTCYRGGILVEKNYQMCKVTNRKILDILNGKIPKLPLVVTPPLLTVIFNFGLTRVKVLLWS